VRPGPPLAAAKSSGLAACLPQTQRVWPQPRCKPVHRLPAARL